MVISFLSFAPKDFTPPPFVSTPALNGQGLSAANNGGENYRPIDAHRLPYTQQWNFTLERQFTSEFYITAGYVAMKGTRLGSSLIPINALDPQRLTTMGTQLSEEFQTRQTELDGVPIPNAGWIEQMTACPPGVFWPFGFGRFRNYLVRRTSGKLIELTG